MTNREFREQLEDRTTQYAVEALPLTPPLLTPPLTHFYIGLCGVVGGMMVIELLAGTMRRGRRGIVAVEDDMRQTYTVKHMRKGLTLLSYLTCRYNDDFARRVVIRLNHTAKSHHGACCDGCKGFGVFVEKTMKILLSQKNPSFREEQEERFLLMGFPREKAEIIKGKPRILVKDSNIPNAISCVRMSPHGDNERDRFLVEIIRDKYGLKFSIEQSNSSFNGR